MKNLSDGRHVLALSDFVRLHKEGHLKLDPAFQRSHAWKPDTRQKLVQTILQGRSIPEVLLFQPAGSESFVVIDGKQRLETMLSFAGAAAFPSVPEIKAQHADQVGTLAALEAAFPGTSDQFLAYEIGVVVCSGDVADAAPLFRSWNTCSGLTPAEIRNAEFYGNPLYREVKSLADLLTADLVAMKLVADTQPDRMQKEEIITELICNAYLQELNPGEAVSLNGKAGVERVLSEAGECNNIAAIEEASGRVRETIQFMSKWFTSISQSRFRYRAAFFTLFAWTKTALDAGYGRTLSANSALLLNGAIAKMSADITEAAKAGGSAPALFTEEEVAEVKSTLKAASDARTARTKRMNAISSALSRALASLIEMERFPSVEEMLAEAEARKRRSAEASAA